MDKIVKASSRQVFGLLLGLVIISWLVEMAVVIGLLPAIVSDLLYIVVALSNIGWILVTGTLLDTKKNRTLNGKTYAFIFIGLLLVVTTGITRLFSKADEIMSSATIKTIFIAFVFSSFFWLAIFTAKSLKSNETKEEIDINDYFGDIFLIAFWPIGVWMIQPSVNKIFTQVDKGQETSY